MTTHAQRDQEVRTARITGFWYLMLAISGMLGFLVFHSKVYTADPSETLTNLIEEETLARVRLLFEFAVVVFQALVALWFYRLFRKINSWAALSIMLWGTVNSVIILISAISMGASLEIAMGGSDVVNKVALIDMLTGLISGAWNMGGLFFGLWLIPMGYIITKSKRMPVWLGRILMIGGIGYILSAFAFYSPFSGPWADYLTLPATVGEFWIIGYLLIFGIRPASQETETVGAH